MKTLFKCSLLSLYLVTTSAFSWDGALTGKIVEIDAVGGIAGAPGAYDIRVSLDNTNIMCTGAVSGGQTWAFVNANDGNYKGLLAVLTLAYSTSRTVTLYTTKTSSGFCQLGYVAMQ